MSNTIQSKTLATTPLSTGDILAVVQGGVLKRTTVGDISNDYEEGTWTPTYSTTGTDFDSVTYDAGVLGKYRKIGDAVYVQGRLRTDAITKGSASGGVIIGGLPFPVRSGGLTEACGIIGFASSFLADYPISFAFIAGGSTASLYKRATADGATAVLAVADMGTGTNANDIPFSGWYIT